MKTFLTMAAVSMVIVMTSSSCSFGARERADGESRECKLSPKAVPSCGVLWGVSTQPRTLGHLESLERQLGRPFDMVYHYNDIDGTFPDALERREVAGGRLLHIAIAARDFHGSKSRSVSWRDVANGKFDESLAAQARGVASLGVPVFVTFAQEANSRAKLGVDGSAADFIDAWRHLHDLYVSVGATNAVWTWVMTGSAENLSRAASLWPGNDVVDWISWNVYNGAGCAQGGDPEKFESFEDRMRIFYDFVKRRGSDIGMDPSKPMMISEAGSMAYAVDGSLAADWYAAIPSALQKYPQIKAVTLWNSATESCDFRFDTSSEAIAGVRRAGLDPLLDTGSALAELKGN